jgi:hypothetical protein
MKADDRLAGIAGKRNEKEPAMPTLEAEPIVVTPAPTTPVEAPRAERGVDAHGRHTRRLAVEGVLFLALLVSGGLLFWGSNFAGNMVHDQLAAQRIYFPDKGSDALDPAEFPGLQQYAGQMVDSGPKAKAYANEFIAVHLNGVADGKTYSELSAESRANPDDQQLAGQVQTLFRGETLRGLLLYAWGWSVVGMIAFWVAMAAFAGAAVVAVAMVYGFVRPHVA